jgi:hypothetical protein
MALLSLEGGGGGWRGSSQDERYLSSCTFYSLLCSSIEFSNEASLFHSEISKTVFLPTYQDFRPFFRFT